MRFQIGAMSVGDILDRAVRIFLRRLIQLMTITVLVSIPELGMNLLYPRFVNQMMVMQGQSTVDLGAVLGFLGYALGLLIVTIVVGAFRIAAILRLVTREFLDEPARVGDALGFAARRFGGLIWTSFLFGLVMLAAEVGMALPGGILIGVGFTVHVAAGIAMILLTVPAFCSVVMMLVVWFVFRNQVVVVENRTGAEALRRSRELTKGFRWRVLGVMLLMWVLGLFASLLSLPLQFIFRTAQTVPTEHGPVALINPVNYAIVAAISYFLISMVNSFNATCWTLFYYDLRIRKEGFDLELALSKQKQQEPELA